MIDSAARGSTEYVQMLGLVADAGQLAASAARVNRQVEGFDGAQGTRDGRATLATVGPRIAEIAETWDPETMPAEAFAKQVASEHIPTNASPAYLRSFDSTFVPQMIGFLETHRAGIVARDEVEMIRLRGEGFVGLTDPEQAREQWEALRGEEIFRRRTDDELMMLSVLPAAESAARAGLRKEFEALQSVIGDRFPAPMRLHDAMLRASEARNRAEDLESAQQHYADLRRDGVLPETLRQFAAKDPRLDSRSRLTIEQGIDAMESADLRETQQQHANALQRDIGTGRWLTDETGTPSMVTTVDEIDRRMYLDASDPEFLPASTGLSFLSSMRSGIDTDARYERVRHIFGQAFNPDAPEGRFIPPLTAADDKAVIKYLADSGIVQAAQDGQQAILHRITNPIAHAHHARTVNRLTRDAADLIRGGLSSSDAAQSLEAATAYAALAVHAPHLAASMDLDGTAAMRARYIDARTDQLGRADDPEHLRSNVSLLMQEAGRFRPVDIADAQVHGLIFWRNPDHKRATDATEVNAQARSALQSGLASSTFWKEMGFWQQQFPRFMGGSHITEPPADVVNTFRRLVTEEFKFARAIHPSEQAAAASAKRIAVERTLAQHPPLLWNGTLYWTNNSDLPASPEIQEAITRDLMTPPPDAGPQFQEQRRELVRDLITNYVPVWSQEQQGFLFHSMHDPLMKRTIWTDDEVGPLVLDPFSAPVQSDSQKALDAIDAAENRRRQQERQRRPMWLEILGAAGGPMLP